MESDDMKIQLTPASTVAYSYLGMTCLSFLYGLYGLMLTFLQFLRLGPKRFFSRVHRPTPPSRAMDPIYGTHGMLKLKVFNIFLNTVLCVKYFSLRVYHFIMFQKVYRINQ